MFHNVSNSLASTSYYYSKNNEVNSKEHTVLEAKKEVDNVEMLPFTRPLSSDQLFNQLGKSIMISNTTIEKITDIIENEIKPNAFLSQSELITLVSNSFLGVPYLANTLIGGPDTQEVLVANFDAVDCFTYLDYVFALTKSSDISTFLDALINTRYKDSTVSYYNRKHFFTDWSTLSPQNAIDITSMLSPNAMKVTKQLNQKADGGEYIYGLGVTKRDITYIPSQLIDQVVLNNLKNGDLVGIYSSLIGLDVSHTGIIIKQNGQVLFRNASSLSQNRAVVDTPFKEYISSKPGIIVLRAKE